MEKLNLTTFEKLHLLFCKIDFHRLNHKLSLLEILALDELI